VFFIVLGCFAAQNNKKHPYSELTLLYYCLAISPRPENNDLNGCSTFLNRKLPRFMLGVVLAAGVAGTGGLLHTPISRCELTCSIKRIW